MIVWHVLAAGRWVVARTFGVCSGGPGRDDRVEMMGDDRVERRRGGGLSLTVGFMSAVVPI